MSPRWSGTSSRRGSTGRATRTWTSEAGQGTASPWASTITTRGIFPSKDEEPSTGEQLADALAQVAAGQVLNYASVRENEEDAKAEVERLIGLGYAERITEAQVKEHFSQGTVSKLGVVVKVKDDGSKKVRLVIDMRRSGTNAKAELPERLVLPRVWDAVRDLRRLHQAHPKEPSLEERRESWARELVMVDISDAFPHFKVDQQELEHCITPDVGREGYLLFKAMLFGSKCAPLLWSRLRGPCTPACPRPAQGPRCSWTTHCGVCKKTLQERNRMLAFILYTLDSVGLRVSFGKGERGSTVTWTGIRLQLLDNYTHGIPSLLLTLPEKFMRGLLETLEGWGTRGMAGVQELRSAAGRVSWLAGILPPAKWVLAVFYAVLTERSKEIQDGREGTWRERRRDQRNKDHLFPVKRLEQARAWLVAYLKVAKERPTRTVSLGGHLYHSASLLTDASPEGLGAILLLNNKVHEALHSPVDHRDAEALRFELGSSAS